MDPYTIAFLIGMFAGIVITGLWYEIYVVRKMEKTCETITADQKKSTQKVGPNPFLTNNE